MNLQCKDIPDEPILIWLNQRRKEGKTWACWYSDLENSIDQCMPSKTPSKLRIAKMKKLIGRGLVSGCPCGCRGDYEITQKGIDYLERSDKTINMKKAELEKQNKQLKAELLEAQSDIGKLVQESLLLGEDVRGRPFLIEDIGGFTLTPVMDEHNSFVSKEIFSLDGYHISRGKGNTWYVVTPEEVTIPVEINDMFEGIMILRALGLKKVTFQGLMEPHELFDEFKEDYKEIEEMRDERLDNEEKTEDNK